MTIRHTEIDSMLGSLTLVADGDDLVGVYFPHHWYRPAASTFGTRVDVASDAVLTEVARQLTEYLAGRRQSFDLPTRAAGTDVQRRVWALLEQIPYGDTRTYGELAMMLDDGTSARDVGGAVGRNPLSVVVACHRVVGKNGSLTGYAGGVGRKQQLLDLENAHAPAGPRSRAMTLL